MNLTPEQYEEIIEDRDNSIMILLAYIRREDKTPLAKLFAKTLLERNELDRQLADQRAINDMLHAKLNKQNEILKTVDIRVHVLE